MKSRIHIAKYTIKKWLIKLGERFTNYQEANKELEKIFVHMPQEVAGQLRRKLNIDEASYRFIKDIGHRDARSYFLYSVLSEVGKASVSNMRVFDFTVDSEEDEKYRLRRKEGERDELAAERKEFAGRLIFESITDEQNVWRRKLSECLCDLICFSETNQQPYFRMFIAANMLSDVINANRDFQEFFSCQVENITQQGKDAFDIIKNTSTEVKREKCWFLDKKFSLETMPTVKNRNILATYRRRYIRAISLASEGERGILGFTYGVGYGGLSKSIHHSTENPLHEGGFDRLREGVYAIGLLIFHVLNRAYAINNTKPSKAGAFIFEELMSGEKAKQLHFLSAIRGYEKGDLVTRGDDLAEVLDIRTSEYGYKSYYVRYLASPFIESIKEEWLPARYIYKRIAKKGEVRCYYEGILQRNPHWAEDLKKILSMSDDELYNCMRRLFIELTKKGLLRKMLMESERTKSK